MTGGEEFCILAPMPRGAVERDSRAPPTLEEIFSEAILEAKKRGKASLALPKVQIGSQEVIDISGSLRYQQEVCNLLGIGSIESYPSSKYHRALVGALNKILKSRRLSGEFAIKSYEDGEGAPLGSSLLDVVVVRKDRLSRREGRVDILTRRPSRKR